MPGVPAVIGDGSDGQSGHCSVLVDFVYLRRRDSGITISAGRYHDRLRREADRWRFVERRITLAPGFGPR
jgi:hypothetical protein